MPAIVLLRSKFQQNKVTIIHTKGDIDSVGGGGGGSCMHACIIRVTNGLTKRVDKCTD